ncbi:MAG: amidohydrolase family protein, partial [Clostridia bacterium]|nr:amidohydrolase family protein [Clostridia bacterium]
MKTAFINGYVFDTDKESFVRRNVICEDGFVCDITNGFVPHGCEVIDISGKYLIPGMVDVHTHGIGGYDFTDASEENIKYMCKTYAKNGTTSVMATLASVSMTKLVNSIFAINPNRLNEDFSGANILGVHMEGRYLSPEKRGAHATEFLALPDLKELDTLSSAMLPAPMHFSVAPELEGCEDFIKKIVEIGGTVGIAHTNATYEQAYKAVKEWGACAFTHTFNAMTPV